MKQLHLSTTNILIGVFSIFFVLTTLLSLSHGTMVSTHVLESFGAERLDLVFHGEIWRILTSAFLHAGPLHFAVNVYAFYSLGYFIESFYGKKKMLVVFLFASMIGSIASLSTTLITGLITRELIIIPSVGASGGLFGFLGLLLGNKLKKDIYSPQIPIESKSLLTIIIVNLLIGFSFPFINNSAHIGGLIAGIIFGLLLKPMLTYSNNKLETKLVNFLFILSILLILISFIFQLITQFR